MDGDGSTPSRFRLGEPATACVPMPGALISRLSDVALTAYTDGASLTVLGTELTRADDGGYVVCGRVSELPARLAVGIRGAPVAVTDTGEAAQSAEGAESLPNTGATALSSYAAWSGMLAGFALVFLAVGATIVGRWRRRHS